MLVLRYTRKLLTRLGGATAPPDLASTTTLGDWYATLLPMQPSHLILLVNERSRLPVVLPARKLSTLRQRIPDAVADVFRDLGVGPDAVARERSAMAEMAFAPTQSRSVLGTMNEMVFELRARHAEGNQADLHALSLELSDVLVTVGSLGIQHPGELAQKLLAGRGAWPTA